MADGQVFDSGHTKVSAAKPMSKLPRKDRRPKDRSRTQKFSRAQKAAAQKELPRSRSPTAPNCRFCRAAFICRAAFAYRVVFF